MFAMMLPLSLSLLGQAETAPTPRDEGAERLEYPGERTDVPPTRESRDGSNQPSRDRRR